MKLSTFLAAMITSLVTSLCAAEDSNRIFELRTYYANEGKLDALHARFRDHTCELFEKHGIKNIGYWENDVGPNSNTLTYLLAYPSHDSRAKSWKEFRNDPEWQKVVEDSHKDGIIVKNVENQLLNPANLLGSQGARGGNRHLLLLKGPPPQFLGISTTFLEFPRNFYESLRNS